LLSATALTGTGTDGAGVGVGGDPLQTEGDAASLIADSFLFNRRLRLRGEVAATSFDFDGVDTGFDAESDNATTFLTVWTPWEEKLVKERPLVWNVGFEAKRVGTFFHSLANPDLANDVDLLRLFSDFDWAGWTLGLSIGREEDNVNDIAGLGRTQTDQAAFNATYSPIREPGPDGTEKKHLLGQPTYSAGLFNSDQDVIEGGSGLSEGKFNSTSSIALSAIFGYTRWSWGIGYTFTDQEDFVDPMLDTRTNDVSLNADFLVGKSFTIAPVFQWTGVDEPTTGEDESTFNATVAMGYEFTSKLRGNLSLAVNRNKRSDDTVDTETRNVDFSLNWAVAQPAGARPGFTLGLQGLYQDVDDKVDPSLSGETYEVFFTVGLSWAPTY
jgi:hypothetical protein